MENFKDRLQCPAMIGMPERLRKAADEIESGKIRISLENAQKLDELLTQIEKGELQVDFLNNSNTFAQRLSDFAHEVQSAVGNEKGER